MKVDKRKLTRKDYIFCDGGFVDLWKYDNLTDAGHRGHKWRFVTAKELKKCLRDCEADGCFDEEYQYLPKRLRRG